MVGVIVEQQGGGQPSCGVLKAIHVVIKSQDLERVWAMLN
jgi:hypothetical protein